MTTNSTGRPKKNAMQYAIIRILVIAGIVNVCFFILFYTWTGQYYEKMHAHRCDTLVQLVTVAKNTIEPTLEEVRRGKLTREQGIEKVRNVVRKMVYRDHTGDNYIFMSNYKGVMLVQPFEPQKEGTNQWNLKDFKGHYFIQDLIRVAKSPARKGFVTYSYTLPSTRQPEEKISYVVGIPELQAYIGTGKYMGQIRQEQKAMLQRAVGWSMGFMALLMIPTVISLWDLHRRNQDLEYEMAERKKVQEALGDSEERLAIALDNVNDGVWDWRAQEGMTYFSPRWYTMLGYEVGEFPSRLAEWKRLIHPEDVDRVEQAVRDILENRVNVYKIEYRMRMKDGSWRWILSRGRPVSHDSEGKVVRMVGTHTDVTDRKLAEDEVRRLNAELENRVKERTAQLEVANRELESFAYSVSHDLQAPLRSINGFSRILLEDYKNILDENGQDMLSRICGASVRMGQLIEGLLSLSRTTRSQLRIDDTDLSRMAEEVVGELRHAEPDRVVDVTIAADLKTRGDPQLLRLVMTNLLSNAWKFTGKCARARIEVGQLTENEARNAGQGGKQVFYVRDNGVGFNMEYAGKLFGAFQRLCGMNEFPGTGIGLATVQRIVRRHGGSVWGEGKENAGATFYFTLE